MNLHSPYLFDTLTNTLTFVTTYACTAACEQCCFGCNPHSEGRLSLDLMQRAIVEAKRDFPSLSLVVFTGGECFLLKEDLFAAIRTATDHGLATRCVSNGSWGKSLSAARRIAKRCKEAGLNEINFSTGQDHREFVPMDSVLNSAEACLEQGMPVLITEEQGSSSSEMDATNQRLVALRKRYPATFVTQINAWMPFTAEEVRRPKGVSAAMGPCKDVFKNVVVTPHAQVSACCGLTYEHIPEMILGRAESGLRTAYSSQGDDLVKVWLRVEGPAGIARGMLPPEEAEKLIAGCNHLCELCARVHQNDSIRLAPVEKWAVHAPRVLEAMALLAIGSVAVLTER